MSQHNSVDPRHLFLHIKVVAKMLLIEPDTLKRALRRHNIRIYHFSKKVPCVKYGDIVVLIEANAGYTEEEKEAKCQNLRRTLTNLPA